MTSTAPARLTSAETVSAFLQAMTDGDAEAAASLLHPDVVYRNVSLPPIRGQAVDRLVRRWCASRYGFEVAVHRLAADGDTVLTERTDALVVGPVRAQFWCCGTFEVLDGRIVLWRDYFDWANLGASVLRGVAAAVVPTLRRALPTRPPR